MSVRHRNNVRESGSGPATLFLAHGFGCDQHMWRYLTPYFQQRYRIVCFDLVGAGQSDATAFDEKKYATLDGHAADVLEIVREFSQGPAVFVGHSVSAMIGLLADLREPGHIAAHAMLAPSPCYVNDDGYHGGFSRADVDSLLDTLAGNYLGWSSAMAPAIMGSPEQPALGTELANSFCRTDPRIARHFAGVTFLSDHRPLLPRLGTPTLVVQCDEDFIAPVAVGEYMQRMLPDCLLRVIHNVGHCPHMSQPAATAAAMDEFLALQGL